MNYIVATTWKELNDWQLGKIAMLLLNTTQEKITEDYLYMLLILFQKSERKKDKRAFHKLISQVPMSELRPYAQFLLEPPIGIHSFPVLAGLRPPADRLGDISIKQFSYADNIFYLWRSTKKEVYLRQLVATLYRFQSQEFNRQKLPQIAQTTDTISIETAYQIGLTYLSVRNYITDKYPKIFPKPPLEEEKQIQPVFRNDREYIPFSKIIMGMAMDERQPLGALEKCNQTLIYDFLDIFEESIIRQEKIKKEYDKLK